MSQITTHILDTSHGKPAVDVPIILYQQNANGWLQLGVGKTNQDGRIADLLADDMVLASGVYRLHFDTKAYFNANNESSFYPYVDIVFEITAAGEHYHVPLLLTAYGYSTYRGS
jgi:5-hydroxyisourate hydrolase